MQISTSIYKKSIYYYILSLFLLVLIFKHNPFLQLQNTRSLIGQFHQRLSDGFSLTGNIHNVILDKILWERNVCQQISGGI